MKAAYQKLPSNASPENSDPALPWPIPAEGAQIEVARWWHDPTEQKNAWEWVYMLKIIRIEPDCFPGSITLAIRAWRHRVDYFSKKESGLEPLLPWQEIEIRPGQKEAPEELRQAFLVMVEQIRRKASQHEAAYQRAADAAEVDGW